jgi:chaperonin GroES
MSKPGTMVEAPARAKTIRPLHDYILCRPLMKPGMVGRIYLPDCDSIDMKNGTRCEVVAVGPGRLTPSGDRIPMEVSVGETVHLTAYGTTAAGMEVVVNSEKLIMIRSRDINGIVEPAA